MLADVVEDWKLWQPNKDVISVHEINDCWGPMLIDPDTTWLRSAQII